VAAVVIDEAGRVLLTQRRDNGKWEPPGGVLELNEPIVDGLRREVYEETGLHVEPDRLTGVHENMTRGVVALVFRAHIVDGEAGTTDQRVEHRGVAAAQVLPSERRWRGTAGIAPP